MTVQSLAHFNGQSLSIIDHDGRKWLTAEDAGRALGYGKDNARDGVLKLYERHNDEFTEADSVTVKLTATDGKAYNKRIFSETGCNKLGFFASTAVAKQFRQFAAKTLAGQAPDSAELEQVKAELLKLQREKFDANPLWVAIADLRAAGRDGAFIARVLGMTRGQQEHAVQAIRRAGLGHFLPAAALPPVPGYKHARSADASQMHLEV